MKYAVAAGLAIAATINGASAQACDAGTAEEIEGNWYCKAVKAITYSDFGSTGSYNRVINMDGGQCESEPFDYSGALAPLNGEISWNFRGPLNLKQFAHYILGSTSEKRDASSSLHERRGHKHALFHKRGNEKRAIGDLVTATMDGTAVSWANQYGSGNQPTAAPKVAEAPEAPGESTGEPHKGLLQGAAPGMSTKNGEWGRQAYYNAEQQVADGLVFLNNMGGQGSGVFDESLGMSLSYASADAKSGSASAQTLANQVLGDGDEVVIMTDRPCTDGDCGTTRPGGVAYHGFDGGPDRLFLLEFDMPLTGATGWNKDMPSVWILNAEIPNTAQYGDSNCSCWKSGCGEWDILEVLDAGNTRCKSTIHGNIAGGDSNYFDRPVNATIKIAVIFDGDNRAGHIVVLPDDTAFDQTLPGIQITAFVNTDSVGSAKSLFRLGSYQ